MAKNWAANRCGDASCDLGIFNPLPGYTGCEDKRSRGFINKTSPAIRHQNLTVKKRNLTDL